MKQIVTYIRSRQGERPLRAERRRETRRPSSSPCTYGLMCSVNRDEVILEEGRGTAMNESFTGMRLLLGLAPPKGKLLEIHITHATFRCGVYLVEVCWTKPLREEAQGMLCLVGCRLKFITTQSQVI